MFESIEFTGTPYGNSVLRAMYADLPGSDLDFFVPDRHPVAGGHITSTGVVIRLPNGFEVEQPWAQFSHRRFVHGGLGIYREGQSVLLPEFLFQRSHFDTEETWRRFLSVVGASVRPWSFWRENSLDLVLWLAFLLCVIVLAVAFR